MSTGSDDIFLATQNGQSIRFEETQIRETGRVTRGVKGITLNKGDQVVGMEIVNYDATILVVSENGYGKRTSFDQYRAQTRGGKGVITLKTSDRNGAVVGVMSVGDTDEVMLISQSGKAIRMKVKDISVIGRNTQGVRLINLNGKDKLVGITRVFVTEAEAEAENNENNEVTESIPEDFV